MFTDNTNEPLREIEPVNVYYWKERGIVFYTIQPDPPFKPGEWVRINGVAHQIRGIEAFRDINGEKPGRQIGVLIKAKS